MDYKTVKLLFITVGICLSFNLTAQTIKRDTITTIIVNGKYSVIDIHGKYIFKNYDKEIGNIPGTDHFAIRSNNRTGVMDIHEKIILPVVFPHIYPGKKVYLTKNRSNNICSFDLEGKLLFLLDGTDYQLSVQNSDFSENTLQVKYKEKWGYLNREGKKVIDFEYDEASSFKAGYAIVGKNSEGRMIYGLINMKNKIIIPIIYDLLEAERNSNYVVGIEQSRKGPLNIQYKYGLLNTDNKITIPIIYDSLMREENLGTHSTSRFFLAYDEETKWKLIDSANNEKLCCFESMTELHGNILVAKNKKWGVVDISGKEIIPFIYDKITIPDSNVIAINKDKKWGFTTTDGSPLTDLVYDNAPYFQYGLSLMKKEGKYQIINNKGQVILDDVPTEWYTEENACTFSLPFQSPTVFTFYSKGKFGLMDLNKNIIFPAIVESCLIFFSR